MYNNSNESKSQWITEHLPLPFRALLRLLFCLPNKIIHSFQPTAILSTVSRFLLFPADEEHLWSTKTSIIQSPVPFTPPSSILHCGRTWLHDNAIRTHRQDLSQRPTI